MPAGQPATARLVLENVSFLPTGLLLLEDEVPYALGSRPRFTLDRVGPGQHRVVQYPIRSDARGRYRIGPLRLRLADPFGLVELTRSFTAVDILTVVPAVHPLPPIKLGGAWESRRREREPVGRDSRRRRRGHPGIPQRRRPAEGALALDRPGRRAHGPPGGAALAGRATVLLDTRADAHRGDGPGSSFEWAVSALASVGVYIARRGYSLRMLTDAGVAAGGAELTDEGVLLDHLAEVQVSRNRTLDAAAGPLRGAEGLGTLIAVVGILDPEQATLLASTRSPSEISIAVLVDANSWLGLSPRAQSESDAAYDASVEVLMRAGWRVVRARHGDRLPELWPAAGQRPGGVALGTAPLAQHDAEGSVAR